MCEEYNREFLNYEFLDENFEFNLKEFTKALDFSLEKKDRVVCVFNSPANNPTGFSIEDSMWDVKRNFSKNLEICQKILSQQLPIQ